MKNFLQTCCAGLLAAAAVVSAESTTNGYLRDVADGYAAETAYQLRAGWNLPKFLTVTPEGAYSYLHLAENFPHATIYRAGPVVELPRKPEKWVKTQEITWQDKKQQFHDLVTAQDSPLQGAVVIHRGKVVYEEYPGMRPFDNHVWMSNAKPVASLLIAQLQEEGRIDVNKTVADYLPAAIGSDWEKIKLIDVLNMQTGLDLEEGPEQRANPNSSFARFMVAEAGLPNVDGVRETHNQALLAIVKLREPGSAFEYSSANTQMLGLVIEAVTGQRLADVVSDRIWMKVGMEGDAQLGLSPQGNGIIHGLISSRLMDMAKFGMLYTPSWNRVSKARLVSEKILNDIRTGGQPENYPRGVLGPKLQKLFAETPRANAYQWDAVFHDGDFYKGGMNGQGLYISPEKDLVVAWFANGFSPVPMEKAARSLALAL
ncbi:serine hydrolase [Microbulbifer sp. ALW1]|uniref:serine hydrolase domain-containing protein n=1 Tax=Microbulbifer sp. (strain ALW1) TaxID=1516059 RepID=UPI001358D878|nr:serine hydrolase domain-containing protein [Microbulbifer sp. ALW1]